MDTNKKPRTSLDVNKAEMDLLRGLAASLGMYTTRGPQAGTNGSVTLLMRRLAAAYEKDAQGTTEALAAMLPAEE
jgi:hypothetical protein